MCTFKRRLVICPRCSKNTMQYAQGAPGIPCRKRQSTGSVCPDVNSHLLHEPDCYAHCGCKWDKVAWIYDEPVRFPTSLSFSTVRLTCLIGLVRDVPSSRIMKQVDFTSQHYQAHALYVWIIEGCSKYDEHMEGHTGTDERDVPLN